MDELIKESDINQALKLEKLHLSVLAPALMKLLKLDKVNEAYSHNADLDSIQFTDNILAELGIEYEIHADDLANIPKTEPFIAVANHPYGGIDGLILLSILNKVRPDTKVLANYLLQNIPPLKDNIIAVNPFDSDKNSSMNMLGLKEVLSYIKTHPIAIFPAGEVSALRLNTLKVADKKWDPTIGRIIQKAGVKVLPIYFSGHNSLAFNLLGLINPSLRTAKLPSELFNKKEKVIVRIGKPILPKVLAEFDTSDELLRYVRAKTYALSSSIEVKTYFKINLNRLIKPRKIIDAIDQSDLLSDIKNVADDCVYKHDNFEVYISNAYSIPNVLKEITRLREITFRAVGEGTNRSFDTDEFDLYYKHLFIWDTQANALVGSYRLGLGDDLFKQFGKKGFYLSNLFKLKKTFNPILKQSIELGRSFIVQEYQRKPLSLMLLWKGINEFLKQNKGRYNYMIGPVSISNQFSNLSKDLLVAYIRHNHFDKQMSKMVKPRKKFKYQYKSEDKNLLLSKHIDDIKLLDNFIGDIEQNQLKIPVLVKKYLKLNAKIIAFNIDPKFNNSLDGLLILNINEIPDEAFDMVGR
ncbi:MAG: GNAT family N-acyltransferase [Bacteroidota bacterium]